MNLVASLFDTYPLITGLFDAYSLLEIGTNVSVITFRLKCAGRS